MSVVDELLSGSTEEERKRFPISTSVVDEILSPANAPKISIRDETIIPKSTAAGGASALTALKAGVPTDKQAAIKIFAQARGIPESRYRVVGDEIVYQANDGQYYKEIPSIFTKPMTAAGYYAPDVLEATPDIVAGIATSPMLLTGPAGVAGSAAITGGVAAGTNAVRQAIAGLLGDQEFSGSDVATQGLISGGMQVLPFGVGKYIERNIAKDIGKVNTKEVADLTQKAKDLGIQLTPAELTNLPSLKSQQKVLGNIVESADTLGDFYLKRYKEQIQPEVNKFLSKISKVDDPMTAGYRGQSALKDRLVELEKAREEGSAPLYRAAFERSVPVDVAPIVKDIDAMLKIAKGNELKALQRIKANLYREKPSFNAQGDEVMVKAFEDRLPALQRAKFDIDQMFKEESFSSMDKVIQSEVTNIKNRLVQSMGKDNPMYLEANKAFEELSKPINIFGESRAGLSLTEISKDNLNDLANRLFDSGRASPQTIRYTRQQIQAVSPEAWNDVTRAYLQTQWEKAMKPRIGSKEPRIDAGADWKAMILGDSKSQKALLEALGAQQFQALNNLAQVLEAAARVKKLGSDTAFNQRALKEMEDNAPSALAAFARVTGGVISPQKYGQFFRDWATERAFANNAEQLANVITSKDGMNRLRELRKMSPTTPKFISGLAQLAADYGMIGSTLQED
jgi:hypothetical protein